MFVHVLVVKGDFDWYLIFTGLCKVNLGKLMHSVNICKLFQTWAVFSRAQVLIIKVAFKIQCGYGLGFECM